MNSTAAKHAVIKVWSGNLVILFAYLFGTLKIALYSDDYSSMIFTSETSDHALRDLRPGQSVMVYLGYATIANDSQNIWKLKCLSLLGLLVLYNLLISRINQSKKSWLITLGTAVSFCITPFQLYVHWATCWYFTWVAVFGIFAYDFYLKRGWHNKTFGVITLVICISTYPITAYLFIVFLSVVSLINQLDARLIFKKVIIQIWFAIQATLVSIFCSLLFLELKNLESSSRVGFVTLEQIPGKLFWIVSRPIVIGLRPFQVSSPSSFGALLSIMPWILLLALYVLLVNRRVDQPKLGKFSLLVLIVAISLAPLIVTPDNQFEFRLIPGYSWMVVVILFIVLEKLALSVRALKLPVEFIASAIVVIAVTTTNLTYTKFFLNPYTGKTVFLSQALSNCQKAGKTESVVILRPTINFPSRPNLGVLSQSTDLMSDWVPVANVKLVGRSMGLKLSEVIYLRSGAALDETRCYIDLEDYRQEILSNL